MKNIEIKINKNTRMVKLSKTTLGNEGESQQYNLVFSFEDEFVDGQARLEYQLEGQEKQWIPLEKQEESYVLPVLNVLTIQGQINMQLVIDENANTMPVFKSNIFYLYCNESINAVDEAPQGYELWIEQANAKLNEVDNLNIEMNDGVVTITKKDGTTYSENVRGPEGPKGDAGAVKLIPVTEFPTENIETDAIYLLPSENPAEENVYDEYVYTNGNWEKISGGASVSLDGYATEEYVDNAVANIDIREPEYFYVETIQLNSLNRLPINYLDYKTKCLKFGKYVPILVSYRQADYPVQMSSVMVYPVVRANNNRLDCFIGMNDSYITNTSTLDGFLSIFCRMNLESIYSVDDIPEEGTFYLEFKTKSYLRCDNTDVYTPTSDYHPATKKYVDDAVANAGGGVDLTGYATEEYVDNKIGNINTILATLTEVSE